MNENDELEGRLRRALSSVASNTRASSRWGDVRAQIEDPDAARRDLDYVTEAEPRGRGYRPLAALVAFMAVLAGAFGVASLTGDDGAGSPEAAVEAMFEAISNEDPIGVLEAVAPSERKILVPVLERLADELDRLEVSSDELDVRDLQGIDLELSDLQLASRPLSEDYAEVTVTNARFRGDLQLTDLPFAQALRGVVLSDERDPEPFATDVADLKLVTVREDGGWHVGLQATMVRFAEDEDGAPAPDFAGGIPERGAASPEAAAREMIEAFYDKDYRRVIELTPESESAALHVWGPTLVAAAEEDASDSQPRVTMESLDLSVSDGDDDAKVIRPTAYRLTASDEEGGTGELVFDGRCITETFTGPDGNEEHVSCSPFTEDPLGATLLTFYTVVGWGPPRPLVVVEQDGRWFVSAGRSFAASIFDELEGFDPDEALRTVRSMYFGEGWADAPQEFWDGCGVARPAADAPSEPGRAAYERCLEQLPDDYVGPYDAVGRFFVFGFPGPYFSSSDVDVAEASASTTTIIANPLPTSSLPTTTVP